MRDKSEVIRRERPKTRRCSLCGYTERIGVAGIDYSRIGPYSGVCFDCLSRVLIKESEEVVTEAA